MITPAHFIITWHKSTKQFKCESLIKLIKDESSTQNRHIKTVKISKREKLHDKEILNETGKWREKCHGG